jgi:hypothetical protein
MSATLPPTAGLDRPRDFGALWQPADAAPRLHSAAPEAEPPTHGLTEAQSARRMRLQRLVAYVISGLFAFTAVAAIVYAVKRHHEAALVIADAAATPTVVPAQLTPSAVSPNGSDVTPALETAPAPVVTTSGGQPAVHAVRPHANVVRPKPAQTRAARPSLRKLSSR